MFGIPGKERNDIENRSAMATSHSRTTRLVPNLIYKIKRYLELSDESKKDMRNYTVDTKKEKKIIKEIGMAITLGIHIGFMSLGGGLGVVYQNPTVNGNLITEETKMIDIFISQKIFLYDKLSKKLIFGTFSSFLPLLFQNMSGSMYVYNLQSFLDVEFNIKHCSEYKMKRILIKMLSDDETIYLEDYTPPYDISNFSFEEKLDLIPYMQKLGELPSRGIIIEVFNKILLNSPRHIPKYKQYVSWIKTKHIFDILSDARHVTEHEIHINFATRCWTDHELISGPVVMINSSTLFGHTEFRTIKNRLIVPLYIHNDSFRNTKINLFRTHRDIQSNNIFLCIGNRALKIFSVNGNHICDDTGEILSNHMNHISPYKTYNIANDLRDYIDFFNNNYLLVVAGENIGQAINLEEGLTHQYNLLAYLFPLIIDVFFSLFLYVFVFSRDLNILGNYIKFITNPQSRLISAIIDIFRYPFHKIEPPSIQIQQLIRNRKNFFNINKFLYISINNKFKQIVLYDENLYRILRLQISNPYRKISHNRRIIEFEQNLDRVESLSTSLLNPNMDKEMFFLMKNHQHVKLMILLSLISIIPDLVVISLVSQSRFQMSLEQKKIILATVASYILLYLLNTVLLISSIKYKRLIDKLTLYLLVIHKSKLIVYPLFLIQCNLYLIIMGLDKMLIKLFLSISSIYLRPIPLFIVYFYFFSGTMIDGVLVYIATIYSSSYNYLDTSLHSI
jgi:hypothetical protein